MNIKGMPISKFMEAMLDIIPTWKTADEIANELLIKYDYEIKHERDLRKMFEIFNLEYEAHLTDGYYIAHGTKGHKITRDYDDMRKSDTDLYKRCMKMLKKISHNKKVRGEDMHLFRLDLVQDIKKLDNCDTE